MRYLARSRKYICDVNGYTSSGGAVFRARRLRVRGAGHLALRFAKRSNFSRQFSRNCATRCVFSPSSLFFNASRGEIRRSTGRGAPARKGKKHRVKGVFVDDVIKSSCLLGYNEGDATFRLPPGKKGRETRMTRPGIRFSLARSLLPTRLEIKDRPKEWRGFISSRD